MLETHLLGRGIERACYRDPVDPERCFKVSEKTSCRQTRRDIVFFERLARLGIESSYVPKYLGAFETETKIGFFQECFARPGVRPLSEFMAQCSREALLRTDLALWEMRGELIEKNIVAIDVHPDNILVVPTGPTDADFRLVLIDGYGTPEFIPIPYWFRALGRRKIDRYWTNHFMKRLAHCRAEIARRAKTRG